MFKRAVTQHLIAIADSKVLSTRTQCVSKPPTSDEEDKISGILKKVEGASVSLTEVSAVVSTLKTQVTQSSAGLDYQLPLRRLGNEFWQKPSTLPAVVDGQLLSWRKDHVLILQSFYIST